MGSGIAIHAPGSSLRSPIPEFFESFDKRSSHLSSTFCTWKLNIGTSSEQLWAEVRMTSLNSDLTWDTSVI